MSKITLNPNANGTGVFSIDSPATNTNRTLTLPDETSTLATQAFSSNASNLSTGTVPTARLGSGTANNTTFLRGDQTWQAISVTPSTADVLNATAGATVGAVGTYAFLNQSANTAYSPGTTVSGAGLRYSAIWSDGASHSVAVGSSPSGTWRIMGKSDSFSGSTSVWLRIS